MCLAVSLALAEVPPRKESLAPALVKVINDCSEAAMPAQGSSIKEADADLKIERERLRWKLPPDVKLEVCL